MKIKYLDGPRLRNAVLAGSETVFKMREYLNEINLFPIPDKDTGTNLTVTLRNVNDSIRTCSSASIDHMSLVLAEAALLGAQGNSGAILAQFFQGLAEALTGEKKVSVKNFSVAVETAVQKAYAAIAAPVEGTLITVIKDWSKSLKNASQKSRDFSVVLKNALVDAKLSLAATKTKIEVLRKAGVVDAGAQGFVHLLEGISHFIDRGSIREILRPGVSNPFATPLTDFDNLEAVLTYQYCVDCLLESKNADKLAIQNELVDKGDSLAIATSRRYTRVHIHTNEPDTVKTVLSNRGTIQSFQVNDLVDQQKQALAAKQQAQIAIVTDSSCDLPHEFITRYHVKVVPVRLSFGSETFIDKQTITPLEFYEKLRTCPDHPTTSQPTPADFKRTYEHLANHYDTIISIHLAARLSGTFAAAQTAAEKIDTANIVLVDSKTTSIALGMLVLAAGEAIAAGLSIDKVLEKVERVNEKLKIIINIPSLKYLVRGGRVSKGKGLIATLLNIKPMLTFDKTGAIVEIGKAFGNLGALIKTIKMVKAATENLQQVNIGIVHANAIGKAEWLRRKLAALPNVKSIMVQDVAPVLGVHAGPGTTGVGYWGE